MIADKIISVFSSATDIARYVYIQSIYTPCFPKMDTLGLLASQSVSFIGNDISLFYTRATSGFHAAT